MYWPEAPGAQLTDLPADDAVPATATDTAVKSEGEYEKVHSRAEEDAPPALLRISGSEIDVPGAAEPEDREIASDWAARFDATVLSRPAIRNRVPILVIVLGITLPYKTRYSHF